MKTRTFLLLALMVIAGSLAAQVPSGTDIWLLDMSISGEKFTFENALNITARDGYDNQPSFTPASGSVLYTSIREDNQADVYRYDIALKKTIQVTKTPTSEYSPSVMPGGKYISVVMVEKDSAQRLWKFPLNGGEPVVMFPTIDSIGYYAWFNKKSAAFFILTKPFTLQLAHTSKSSTQLLGRNIGRSIHHIQKGGQDLILYVYTPVNETSKYIVACDDKGKHDYLSPVKTVEESEDIAVIDNRIVVMAKGSKLYKYDLWKDNIWHEIADLSSFGISNITRLAISPDKKRIALVSNTNN